MYYPLYFVFVNLVSMPRPYFINSHNFVFDALILSADRNWQHRSQQITNKIARMIIALVKIYTDFCLLR